MQWLIWSLLLLVQNAAFTWVSRARNSGSVKYHGVAAVFSNGIWFASQFFVVTVMLQIKQSHSALLAVLAGVFYTGLTTFSGTSMHWLLMKKVEKGERKVGG